MEGAPGTLYEGEKFQLLFKFSGRYPFDSPQVSAGRSEHHIAARLAGLKANSPGGVLLTQMVPFRPPPQIGNVYTVSDVPFLCAAPLGLFDAK